MSALKEYNKIKDSDFDVNLLSQYNLYLHVYLNNLNVCVVDTQADKCLLFEQHDFTTTAIDITLLECLKNIWDSHQLLSAPFWNKVVVISINQDFTFIPTKYYSEETALFYLKANCEAVWEQHEIMHTKHDELDTVSAFPVNQDIVKWLSGVYTEATIQYAHFNSCWLQGLLTAREDKVDQVNVLVHPDVMSIAVVQNQRLKFINSFPQSSPQDVLYFVLFVMEEAGLSPSKYQVKLWGNAPYLPACEEIIRSYVKEVHLGEMPTKVVLGDGFEALPAYFGFDLFSAYFLLK